MKRLFELGLVGLLGLGLSGPALAEALAPPDASGPSATDFTSWRAVYLILGGWDLGTQSVTTKCINVGKTPAQFGVQFFDAESSSDIPVLEGVATADVGEENALEGAEALGGDGDELEGTFDGGDLTGRVLVPDNKAKFICTAMQIDTAAVPDQVAPLRLVPMAKELRPKLVKP